MESKDVKERISNLLNQWSQGSKEALDELWIELRDHIIKISKSNEYKAKGIFKSEEIENIVYMELLRTTRKLKPKDQEDFLIYISTYARQRRIDFIRKESKKNEISFEEGDVSAFDGEVLVLRGKSASPKDFSFEDDKNKIFEESHNHPVSEGNARGSIEDNLEVDLKLLSKGMQPNLRNWSQIHSIFEKGSIELIAQLEETIYLLLTKNQDISDYNRVFHLMYMVLSRSSRLWRRVQIEWRNNDLNIHARLFDIMHRRLAEKSSKWFLLRYINNENLKEEISFALDDLLRRQKLEPSTYPTFKRFVEESQRMVCQWLYEYYAEDLRGPQEMANLAEMIQQLLARSSIVHSLSYLDIEKALSKLEASKPKKARLLYEFLYLGRSYQELATKESRGESAIRKQIQDAKVILGSYLPSSSSP